MDDLISRQAAIDAIEAEKIKHGNYLTSSYVGYEMAEKVVKQLPPIQSEIIRCKDCQYWNKGSCECREHAVNCQDYYVGDIETEAEYFCGYADRREVRE